MEELKTLNKNKNQLFFVLDLDLINAVNKGGPRFEEGIVIIGAWLRYSPPTTVVSIPTNRCYLFDTNSPTYIAQLIIQIIISFLDAD